MKVQFNWLKEFVPLEIGPEQAADVLRQVGFEIAGIHRLGGGIEGVVSALVQDVQKHPNADRLSLCRVNDGQQDFSVVCGAQNVKSGIHVPLARIGASLPNGMKITAAKLRGVESQGMICSAAELGMEEKSEGIMILDSATPLGVDIKSVLNLDDTIIELEVTPNRRDALSIIGVARELAAALNLSLKNPEPRVRELEIGTSFAVSNEAAELCPRYIARVIKEVRVGRSPDWMVRRLQRAGIRSINNVVDITNYVMLELGQPLHAFDSMKLRGRRLRIRLAKEGESLQTLEGKTVQLTPEMLVIADEDKPAAVAGVIGGEPSGITEMTSEVVLESAAFAPGSIRKTARKLGISTESSYRFERGSDWNAVALASRRAAQLIQELANGLGFKPIESAPRANAPTQIKMAISRVKQILGLELKEATIADILRRLGCIINIGSGQMLVTVPTWRTDLSKEADLLEEIARMSGYDTIPTRSPLIAPTTVPDSETWMFERRSAEILVGLGFHEAYNFSFLNDKQAAMVTPGLGRPVDARALPLANPLSQDQTLMRTSLLPGLLQNALTNFHHSVPGVALFELGRIFDQTGEGVQETRRIGLLLAGAYQPAHWRQKTGKADFYQLLGLIESFLGAFKISDIQKIAGAGTAFHPQRSATLISGDTVLGWMGDIHPDLATALDINEPFVGAELDIAGVMQTAIKNMAAKAVSAFPPVHRDISLVVPENIPYDKILKTIQATGGPSLDSSTLIDLYRGPTIGADKKSLTLSLMFRRADRTLKDSEVESAMAKIRTDLEKKCEAKIRQ
jgi:phenylalanyl-tRNA synthetase beta chain